MGEYEIIGKLPVLRKRRPFKDFFKSSFITLPTTDPRYKVKRILHDDPRFVRVDGVSLVGDRRTASSMEEATKIAGEMLASGRFESVVIQDPQKPEQGATEFWLEKR